MAQKSDTTTVLRVDLRWQCHHGPHIIDEALVKVSLRKEKVVLHGLNKRSTGMQNLPEGDPVDPHPPPQGASSGRQRDPSSCQSQPRRKAGETSPSERGF